MILTSLTLVVASSLGWSDGIAVVPNRPGGIPLSIQRSLTGLEKPSDRTVETLKRYDLEHRYRKDVDGALATLEKVARAQPDHEVVYALAELSWVEGNRLDRKRKPAAIDRYVDAVAYAYDFLFDPDLASGRQPSDPRFRLACELYNGGLEKLIHAAQAQGKITPDGTITLKVYGREQKMRVALQDSPWAAADVDQIILASEFKVTGLSTSSYLWGLGVPLIGIHKPAEPGKGAEKFYPPEMAFPLTAFLVPNSRLRDAVADGAEPRDCTLQLVDPIKVKQVGSKEAPLPVEADLSMPLAYMWSRTDLDRFRWTGLLRPGSSMHRANLMLLRPYEPGKIPVVMVHGLISSPLAWVPMLNELLRDPVIHEKYQFLLYMYPTGVPIPIAMAGLRETLQEAERMYNPEGRDPAFERMVLLGHSMGGLLSHAMAVDSGNKFWQLYSDRQFKTEILGKPEVLSQLERFLFFQPLPFVKRVVFLATPHRGSDLSRNMVGRIGTSLISDPNYINELLAQLMKDNPDAFDRRQFRRLPTSIETLNTDHDVLLALLAMTPSPDVVFHSIIGSYRAGPVASSTDTVVPYRSSHLDGVESEVTVRSDHGVQKDAEAINEVTRILYKHLGIVRTRAATAATPAGPAARRQAAAPAGPLNRR